MMNKKEVIDFLNLHHEAFFEAKPYANKTDHPTPSDTRSWSQILVSLLTGIQGLAREKGTDLEDGSDVKAANTWDAIDTPRFNGVIKAGTKSEKAGKLESLDSMPFLFFVLWDNEPDNGRARCRVWVVRTQSDRHFRQICREWYDLRAAGKIKSDNFQLHPPRGKNLDVFTNNCGNLKYPLLFAAEWIEDHYEITWYKPEALNSGKCMKSN